MINEGPPAAAAVVACGHAQKAGGGVENQLHATHHALVAGHVAVQMKLTGEAKRVRVVGQPGTAASERLGCSSRRRHRGRCRGRGAAGS